MIDGHGLNLLKFNRSSQLSWCLAIISTCLVLMVGGKVVRSEILHRQKVLYYPKNVIPQKIDEKASDLDLALVRAPAFDKWLNDLGRSSYINPRAKHSLLFPYYEWIQQQSTEDQLNFVSDMDKLQKLVTVDLVDERFHGKEGWMGENEIFASPRSTPPIDYSRIGGMSLIFMGICERLDDGLFANTVGCWLFCVAVGGAIKRYNLLNYKIQYSEKAYLIWACVVGGLLFGVQQTYMAREDHGPLHGWFATDHFSIFITVTQWVDGIVSLIVFSISIWLFLIYVKTLKGVLQYVVSMEINHPNYAALSNTTSLLASAPIRVIRFLIFYLLWLFASDFFKFFNVHFNTPEAALSLVIHVIFLIASVVLCIRYLKDNAEWTVETKGITIGGTP